MDATPFLEFDSELVNRNIDRMASWATAHGVHLRPHVKTHKSLELARRQIAAGAIGVSVATVGEAEVFAAGGVTDIFIAYPLWIDDELARRLNVVSEKCRLVLGVDSLESVRHALPRLSDRIEWRIEVDSGHHRTGVSPEAAGVIATALGEANHLVDGVFSFPGHSYASGGRAAAAQNEADALSRAAEAVTRAGFTSLTVSGGSSPSMEFARTDVCTEFRPGVYLFGDAQQWELGSHSPADIALWARATVVSRSEGRYVTNAGSKILGADRAGYATGYGRILDDPGARIVLLSEHHSVVESSTIPALGSRVRVVPNHVCNAVNLVDELHELNGMTVTVDARGRNS